MKQKKEMESRSKDVLPQPRNRKQNSSDYSSTTSGSFSDENCDNHRVIVRRLMSYSHDFSLTQNKTEENLQCIRVPNVEFDKQIMNTTHEISNENNFIREDSLPELSCIESTPSDCSPNITTIINQALEETANNSSIDVLFQDLKQDFEFSSILDNLKPNLNIGSIKYP